MLIITSAQYIDSELRSEFGEIPPAFLPVGNKRLFLRQVDSFPADERKVMTLPKGFLISECDKLLIEKNKIEVVFIDGALTLKDSVFAALDIIGDIKSPLKLLHGDTLFDTDLDVHGSDFLSLSPTTEFYRWSGFCFDDGKLRLTDNIEEYDSDLVVSGYFNFSRPDVFKDCLANGENFIDAVGKYISLHQFKLVRIDEWLDFGHVHTYFKSKSKVTTQRSFNEMKITPKVVYKKSKNKRKMLAEYGWFASLPAELKIFTPHVLEYSCSDEVAGYGIEYLYMTALNELAVFGRLPSLVWRNIFSSCNEFLSIAKKHTGKDVSVEDLNRFHNEKVFERIAQYAVQSGTDLHKPWRFNGQNIPSIMDMVMHCCAMTRSAEVSDICVSHGDFCFSNMLYDFRSQCIKVIDPRGFLREGEPTIYGDARYDVAKLLHSIIGRYDVIISGLCRVQCDDHKVDFSFYDGEQYSVLLQEACRINFGGYTQEEIIPIVINLFFSMLPLHADDKDRQICLLANAMRLYCEFLGKKS